MNFINEDVRFNLVGKSIIKRWLTGVLKRRGYILGELNIIFCSDEHLLQININSLGHNYLTDIITFDYTEEHIVSGDLFISLDTVLANSKSYRQLYKPHFEAELCRVMVHGVLHLSGEDDLTPSQQRRMRHAENEALSLLAADLEQDRIKCIYKGSM